LKGNNMMNMNPAMHLPVVLLISLFLVGCNQSNPLPGGYAIFIPAGEDSMMLVDSNNEGVAGPGLAQIGNSGKIIFGEIRAMPQRVVAASQTPGYFILETTTGSIESGLSRENWLQKLKQAGVQGEPELVYPGRKGPRK
jgi:hypothetical protein